MLVPVEIHNLREEYNEEQRMLSGKKSRMSDDEIAEAIGKLEEESKQKKNAK